MASDENFPNVGSLNQNVAVYSGYEPFSFAGSSIGGWAFAVDTYKRIDKSKTGAVLSSGAARAIETVLEKALIEQLGAAGNSRRLLVVHGLDAEVLPGGFSYSHQDYDEFRFDPNVYAALSVEEQSGRDVLDFKPIQVCLDQKMLDSVAERWPLRARQYLWVNYLVWGGEIVVSFFIRVSLKNRVLHIEHQRFLLDPGPDKYRPPHPHAARKLFFQEAVKGVLCGPFLALFSAPLIFQGYMRPLRHKEILRAFEEDFSIDFGATQSIRQLMCGGFYYNKFQKNDVDAIVRAAEKIIIEELANFLENEGIDVTDIRNKEMTIFNSGIMINGGDLTAQSLAVGSGATANTNVNEKDASRKAQVKS